MVNLFIDYKRQMPGLVSQRVKSWTLALMTGLANNATNDERQRITCAAPANFRLSGHFQAPGVSLRRRKLNCNSKHLFILFWLLAHFEFHLKTTLFKVVLFALFSNKWSIKVDGRRSNDDNEDNNNQWVWPVLGLASFAYKSFRLQMSFGSDVRRQNSM